jgi:hypothetical protein
VVEVVVEELLHLVLVALVVVEMDQEGLVVQQQQLVQ